MVRNGAGIRAMGNIVRTFFIGLFIISAVHPLHARSVSADGLLRVEGASWQGTRVFVVPATGQAYEFELTAVRFILPLVANELYMLSFERIGCPTKQVLFDTHLPDHVTSVDLVFPFQVTLSYLPVSERFEYEGPVGFVRYSAAVSDFVFTTQYRLKRQKNMTERLDVLRLVPPHNDAAQATSVSSVPFPATPLVAMSTEPVAPEVGTTPLVPIAHVIAEHETVDRTTMKVSTLPQEELPLDPIQVEPSVADMPLEGPLPSVVPIVVSEPVIPPTISTPVVPVERAHIDRAAAPPLCEHHEVVIEPRRITYITRPKREGGCTELRKVVHAYGAVFYFHDHSSITERMYQSALAADKAADPGQ